MLDPDCFEYIPGFLSDHDALGYLQQLHDDLEWQQREIQLFGRRVKQPRLIAWHGDEGAAYRYSGLSLQPRPWHPILAELNERIGNYCAVRFNSVLLNAYRDGKDSMGWHRDDEAELGGEPTIASLSLGASRRFLLRSAGGRGKSVGIELENGSLLVMRGQSQLRYQHSVPKTQRSVGLRINLTFRRVQIQTPV